MSAIGQLALLENEARETFKPDSLEQDSLEYFKAQMDDLRELLAENQILLDSALTKAVKDSLFQIDSLLTSQVKSNAQSIDAILALVKSRKALASDSFKLRNNDIEALALYEANEKTVNDVYFSTLAKEIYTLDSSQVEDVLAIAIQCPLLGGPAVYTARALYAMVADTLYDDIDVCNDNGILFRTSPPIDTGFARVKVYPNPANDLLTVSIGNFDKDNRYWIEVFASDGKCCLKQNIVQKNGELITSGLGSGLYYIRVVNLAGECLYSEAHIIAH